MCIDTFNKEVPLFRLGEMVECDRCGAYLFPSERKTLCCGKGSVQLTPLSIPDELLNIIKDRKVLRQIRAYNQSFAISSIGGIQKDSAVNNGISQTYRVCGQMFHCYGGIHGEDKKFGGVYLLNPSEQDATRGGFMQALNKKVLKALRVLLEKLNPYEQKFRSNR